MGTTNYQLPITDYQLPIVKTMIDAAKNSNSTSVARIEAINASLEEGEKFLRFQLGAEGIALLPLNIIKQVMQVSVNEILPVPQMPGCVLGIYNWRGEMLWLVDLGQLVGFPPLVSSENVMAIAIQIQDKTLGLVVRQINDIDRHRLDQINLPAIGLFAPELMPYLQGYLIKANQEVLMLLNGSAIANAPLWQINRFVGDGSAYYEPNYQLAISN
ncbi:chemotaxis protein CheW [Microseira sp. BLCC-F43]|jgi:positive phototaxis protein PixI|uniref:chemotaxis protein CheW n=1 Tax=Microseira sp. BLCC-F43 TaxID=3153602 RepID=UPI0035B9ACB7